MHISHLQTTLFKVPNVVLWHCSNNHLQHLHLKSVNQIISHIGWIFGPDLAEQEGE